MHLSLMFGIGVGQVVLLGLILSAIWIIFNHLFPNFLKDLVNDWIVRPIVYFFLSLIYWIWKGLAIIVDALETVFRRLAGLPDSQGIVYWVDGKPQTSDIMITIFDRLQPYFVALVSAAFFLLVVFTILAIIRQHYREKDGGNPYIIVFRMFKGMLMFMFITAACAVGMEASRIILKGLDGAVRKDGDIPMSGMIFKAMAYEGNRARADYSQGNLDRVEFKYSQKAWNHFKSVSVLVPESGIPKIDIDWSMFEIEDEENFDYDAAYDQIMEQLQREQGVETWDLSFVTSTYAVNWDFDWNKPGTSDEIDEYMCLRNSSTGEFNYRDWRLVETLYIPTKFNWIIGFGGIFICVSVMLGFTAGLVGRLVELATLYLFSPLTLAFFPFDDGQQFNSAFVKPFYKKTISVFAPVLAMSAFFIIAPRIMEMELHDSKAPGGAFANSITSLIITLILFSMLPKVRNTIQSILGADGMEEKGLGAALKDGWSQATAKSVRTDLKNAYKTTAKGVGWINKKRVQYEERKRLMDEKGLKHKGVLAALGSNNAIGRYIVGQRDANRDKYKKEHDQKLAKEDDIISAEKSKLAAGGLSAAEVAAAQARINQSEQRKKQIKAEGPQKGLLDKAATGGGLWKVGRGIVKAPGTVIKTPGKLLKKADQIGTSVLSHDWGGLNPLSHIKGYMANSALWQTFAGDGGWFEKSAMGKAFFEGSHHMRWKEKVELEKLFSDRADVNNKPEAKFQRYCEFGEKDMKAKESLLQNISEVEGLRAKMNADPNFWKKMDADEEKRRGKRQKIYESSPDLQAIVSRYLSTAQNPEQRKMMEHDAYTAIMSGSEISMQKVFGGENGSKAYKAALDVNESNREEIKGLAEESATYTKLRGFAFNNAGIQRSDAEFESLVTGFKQKANQHQINIDDAQKKLGLDEKGMKELLAAYSKNIGSDSDTLAIRLAFQRGESRVLSDYDENGKQLPPNAERRDITPAGYRQKDESGAHSWYSQWLNGEYARFGKVTEKLGINKWEIAHDDFTGKINDRLTVQSAVELGEEKLKVAQDVVKDLSTEGQQLFTSEFLKECLKSGNLVGFGDECMKAFQGLPSKIEQHIVDGITNKGELENIGKIFQQFMGNPNAEMRGDGNEKSHAVLAKMFRISFIDRVVEALNVTSGMIDSMQMSVQNRIRETLREFEGHLGANNEFATYLKEVQHLIKDQAMMNPSMNINTIVDQFQTMSEKLKTDMSSWSEDKKLRFQDFQAKLNGIAGWEAQNRRDRADGNGIKAAIQEFLNLPGDSQLRGLMQRGAGEKGSAQIMGNTFSGGNHYWN